MNRLDIAKVQATTFVAAAILTVSASASEMFPFVPSYDSPVNVVNMSHLLEAPAGKYGRIRVKDGHFVNDKGRVKLHATNLTGPANFPTHEEAERLAARLARFGINCVRLHYFDSSYGTFMLPKEQGIIDETGDTRRKLDPARRDRQDYLIAQFKKRGIYVNINLHVARTLGEADGIPPGSAWANKGVNQFYPPLIKLQREYAKELLSHVNPYTGLSYLKDPVVAVVELNNEEALWRKYLSGGMDDIVKPYSTCFSKLWSDWLVKKYGTTEKVRAAWKLAENPFPYLDKFRIERGDYPPVHSNPKRSHAPMSMKRDFYQFVTDVEHDFWTGMLDYLKKDLGLEAPVTATQLGYTTPQLMAEMDYVDNHAYWCHPSVKKEWKIRNTAMVNSAASCIRNLASQRVLGKAYTISEYNHPYPNFYGAEGQPMLRAYGALQGWDGVFEYSYNNRQNAEPDHNEYFFSMAARTDVLAHFPACAAMYLRGDVKESESPYVVNLPYNEYFDRFVTKGIVAQGIKSATDMRVPQALCLMRKTAVDLSGKSKAVGGALPEEGQKVFVSDTGEIVLNGEVEGAGYWTVNTPNTKVFSGFTKGRTFDIGGVKLAIGETKLGWATVSLTSHDATGFGEGGRSARVLLAATGLSHNGGAKFIYEGDSLHCRDDDWGHGKTVNEGIPATITLPSKAAGTKCWALDERGERAKAVLVSADGDGRAAVKIGPEYKTVWYEIAVAD